MGFMLHERFNDHFTFGNVGLNDHFLQRKVNRLPFTVQLFMRLLNRVNTSETSLSVFTHTLHHTSHILNYFNDVELNYFSRGYSIWNV